MKASESGPPFSTWICAGFNGLPYSIVHAGAGAAGMVSEQVIDEREPALWGFDTQWNVHQGRINVGLQWHVLDLLKQVASNDTWPWRGREQAEPISFYYCNNDKRGMTANVT